MSAIPSHTVARSARRAGLTTGVLLLVPVIGNQVVDGWHWTVRDFAFAGALIFATAMVFGLLASRSDRLAYKAALAISVLAGFVLLWANLAVGIVGEPDEDWNLLYFGVLAAGALVAGTTRFEPEGMALAGVVVALGLCASAAIVLLLRLGQPPGTRMLVAHALFVTAFAVAAALFHKAAARD